MAKTITFNELRKLKDSLLRIEQEKNRLRVVK